PASPDAAGASGAIASLQACTGGIRWNHRNVEVQQLVAAGVAHPGEINMGAGHRLLHVLDIEEEEPRFRGMRLDRLGGKARRSDLLVLLLRLLVLGAVDRDGAD